MKILQLIYESFGSPFGFGGAGVRAYEIYGRLKTAHEITLLCMRYPGSRNGLIEGLNHVFVGTETRNLTAGVLSYTIKAARFVKRYGREYDVIIENFLPSTPFFSSVLTKTPVILQVQGIMESHSLRKFSPLYSLPMYFVEKFYPRLFENFIFASEVTRDKVIPGLRKKPGLCRTIGNGVNEELLGADPVDGDYILFFSRIDTYTKGLDTLLSAFEALSPEFPGIRLILAGYEYNAFKDLVTHLPPLLRSKISYAGFVTGGEKLSLLSKAKIVVLPSRHESFPVSVLEAAACAKPVIVTDIQELEFVETHGFGLKFPVGDASSLKDTLAVVLKDGALRSRLGRSGRAYARNCLWDSVAREFERTLESVVDEKH